MKAFLNKHSHRYFTSMVPKSNLLHVNLWSNPKTASASLMYSFAQRNDTTIFDEPLYPIYNNDFDDYLSPIVETSPNVKDALKNLIFLNSINKTGFGQIFFYKNMAKQLKNIISNDENDDLFNDNSIRNILLVREPREL
eukprot:475602_1